jgi:CBS domain-containing protein
MASMAEIKNERVGHLDLEGYVATDESTTVGEVIRLMRRFDRTTTLVTGGGRLTGIFTERDVLQKVVSHPETWDRPVSEVMTPGPVVVSPDASLLRAIRLMNQGHFRDLPVVDAGGKISGNLTDNAIVSHIAQHLAAEVINLPPDPNQVAEAVEGA